MEYLKVWTSFRELLEPLNKSERGRLFTAMLEYAETGKVPELKGNERYVWPAAKQSIDNTRDKSEQMRANGSRRQQTGANESKPEQTGANASSPFDKEKDKVNIIDREREDEENDNTRARVIREAWLAEIGKAPTPAVVNRLTAVTYGMDLDVIRLGIRMAALKDKPFEYLLALYPDWQSEHITTLSEADEYIMLQDGVKGKVPMMTAQDAMDRLREFRERATA